MINLQYKNTIKKGDLIEANIFFMDHFPVIFRSSGCLHRSYISTTLKTVPKDRLHISAAYPNICEMQGC